MLKFWLVILLIVLASGIAILLNWPDRGEKHRFLPFVLLLFPPIIWSWGLLFARDPSRMEIPAYSGPK